MNLEMYLNVIEFNWDIVLRLIICDYMDRI